MRSAWRITVCLAVLAAAAGSLAGGGALASEEVDGLYEARVHVTGQEEPARSNGFARALADVLVKRSGDPALLGDPAAAALGRDAGSYVTSFRYRDLLAGIPIHDEQGTRQRPFILTVDFDPAKVDAALRSLGRAGWPAKRPRLILFVVIDNGTAPYLLAGGDGRGRDQREALAEAAWRYGVPVGLPQKSSLDEAGMSVETERKAPLARLQRLAENIGGDFALAGTLAWSSLDSGWTADWRFAPAGETRQWSVRGVSFDEAFRSAILGAARILSGHG